MSRPRWRWAIAQQPVGVLAVVTGGRTELVDKAGLADPIGSPIATLERGHQLVLASLPHGHERYSPR